ncbi:rod shape-determining protein RodA [Candidatus Adlerbacteria bacterium RIFCSPHIGHO2_12_FULL_53_18]|uniref:Rod shape-determining protein RodA n=1 Tax=Candidatus Adlerbacteria bacterium RIFCSPHIGHO2_12_FULL_53_18 TaxID=1797242 RepID=A0A1F4XU29_9BACT|nr:MAG: rod shape-determining protein RodA [Candidatus Adlerbacteria bacterium RIFCSPHIGHO2_12_FULL_53_18]
MSGYSRLKLFQIDWAAFGAVLVLSLLGLVTMASFTEGDPFAGRQALWIAIGVCVFFAASIVDWRFLRRSSVAGGIYFALLLPLLVLVVAGTAVQGARSWFDFGVFALQPVEFIKIGLIIALAKYFSRRHIEIRNIRHILVSGAYALVVFVLVALQPDFGSAIIIFCIWLGLVLVSGISRWHLLAVFVLGLAVFAGLWFFGFQDYQKERILTFIHPLADIQGAGYNAYQSTVAVGSGELFGKGIGYGTQSKLRFLPEYQTDFIFAAFAEEWGFVGVVLLFSLYGVLFVRVIQLAPRGASNFETLFAFGVFFYLFSHFALHVGINMGLLPVTGTTIPFMSYGGSHLLAEFLALGLLSGMTRYSRATPREALHKEFSGGYDQLR